MTLVYARRVFCVAFLGLSILSQAQSVASAECGQSIADVLRQTARADLAFVPQGVFAVGAGSLAAQVQFPTDTVQVVSLTGQQVRAALERAVSLFPTDNPTFLYVSGLTFKFSPSKPAEHRVGEVKVGSASLEGAKKYRVAMPGNLAKGGLGYFKVWPRKEIEATSFGTLEDVLKDKPLVKQGPRWEAVG